MKADAFIFVRGYKFVIKENKGLYVSYRLVFDSERCFILQVFTKGGFRLLFCKYGLNEEIGHSDTLQELEEAWRKWNSTNENRLQRILNRRRKGTRN